MNDHTQILDHDNIFSFQSSLGMRDFDNGGMGGGDPNLFFPHFFKLGQNEVVYQKSASLDVWKCLKSVFGGVGVAVERRW